MTDGRTTYIYRDGKLVDKRFAPRLPPKRSHLTAPYIRSDGMDAIVSQADGRSYDSKSAYERSVRAAGCEIVGNDSSLFREPAEPTFHAEGVEQSVSTAIDQLEAGYRPEPTEA